ncbi:MAG TPA: hypothetical protein VL572_02995 [Pyrinomonadaceae bacterium]|nr:hypothetical protein [Pyrinomonadaceae bacterium]
MDEFGLDDNYPGIDRLQYFLGKAGMIAAVVFTVTVFGPESPVMKVVSLVVMVAGVVLDVMRLRNIGVSQWLIFLRFLPFGGLILDLGLVTAQTGWAKERQLDPAGKTILVFCLVLFAMMLFMWFRVGMAAPWYL